MNLADRISSLRIERGLTQKQLAKDAGVPLSVLTDIEQGVTKDPRISTLRAIAEALGVTVNDLLG